MRNRILKYAVGVGRFTHVDDDFDRVVLRKPSPRAKAIVSTVQSCLQEHLAQVHRLYWCCFHYASTLILGNSQS